MSIRSHIAPSIAAHLLGHPRLERQRAKAERKRLRANRPHVIEVFHDPTDPYSALLMQVLPDFETRYSVDIHTHIISPPQDSAVPERGLLKAYARTDTDLLAEKAGIDFTFEPSPTPENTTIADVRLTALGHYQGGMIYYAGEWYWGIDRLHYLEARLTALGARKNKTKNALIFTPPNVPRRTFEAPSSSTPDIHWYFSFRSPYSAISVDRISALAKNYGADLKLRFVLPMVMRGLEVSPNKKRYIPRDTAREAHRLGVPFGKICDPIGSPVERGYSILHWAITQGRGLEFTCSFFEKVWSEGVDAGNDKGLRKIVEAARLDWTQAKAQLDNENWRGVAETNRLEMMGRGVWGVPSFRVGDKIIWGQDRLWAVEDALEQSLK